MISIAALLIAVIGISLSRYAFKFFGAAPYVLSGPLATAEREVASNVLPDKIDSLELIAYVEL